jgi:hypothetical protein
LRAKNLRECGDPPMGFFERLKRFGVIVLDFKVSVP